MHGYVVVMLACCGITAVAAAVAVWRRVPAKEFFWLASSAMAIPFGVTVGAGSWFAILPGFLAAFWAVMAWTAPPGPIRDEELKRAIRAAQQGEPPR